MLSTNKNIKLNNVKASGIELESSSAVFVLGNSFYNLPMVNKDSHKHGKILM